MTQSEKKTCSHCHAEILAVAKKCRYCGRDLDRPGNAPEPSNSPEPSPGMVDRMLMPVGRPMPAIAAGYLALFGLVPVFGLPFALGALMYGMMGLNEIKRNPQLSGRGRAWFGIIVGGGMIFITAAIAFYVIVVDPNH